MNAARDVIVYLHDGGPIETVAAANLRREFAPLGIALEECSVLAADAYEQIARWVRAQPRPRCFLSSNFWALNVRGRRGELLHKMSGIPLVVHMEDHPVYFLQQLSPALEGTVIFAPGEEFAGYIAAHYPFAARVVANPGYLPVPPEAQPSQERFLQRENALLCPMNLTVYGRNIHQTWETIEALPARRSARVKRLIDAALTDCLTPLHVVSERLAAAGDPEEWPEDARWALDYVKIWRRTQIVEMLAELPALFLTGYVPPHLLAKYPQKFTLLPRTQTMPLYNRYRFVVNSNPLLATCVHERVSDALANAAVVISDPNEIMMRYFRDGRDMVVIDYENRDLTARAAALLDDPARAYAMTCCAWKTCQGQTQTRDAFARLVAALSRN